jgi:hypothetical protein
LGPNSGGINAVKQAGPTAYDRRVTTRSFRIVVRGAFRELTAEQRAALLAEAAEHDILGAAFTRDGHLAYDLAFRPAFTFRFLDGGERESDLPPAIERAEAAARAWLDARGYRYTELKSRGEDQSEAPLGKRQRREARKAV